ncbi:hypothetical protein [Simkania negevensis]|uniref:Uncharacterized protein n=1 Tax=Simkania negevensis (strain ATCC VR-1471 / DSM 27360 / Z) TaxID=331113 RepID=F8L900_SIMNZ|nr:hypothetical protein [Simkania negevensis]MCP5491157.1 hypothetical protein [Chlamydiales bacterium]CCB89307.1 unknown protein [Simkania negevensis Z]
MSVQKSHFGIPNMERYIERTLWTSATFITANIFASMFFSNQSLMNRAVFSTLQAGTFIYLFESTYVEEQCKSCKEYFDGKTAHKLIDYALFFFLAGAPIVVAQGITTWVFQPLSFKVGIQIGIYNYAAGGVGALIYEKIFRGDSIDDDSGPKDPPRVRSHPLGGSDLLGKDRLNRDPLATPGRKKDHKSY